MKSSDESPVTNPCTPVDGPQCPKYWLCMAGHLTGVSEDVVKAECPHENKEAERDR